MASSYSFQIAKVFFVIALAYFAVCAFIILLRPAQWVPVQWISTQRVFMFFIVLLLGVVCLLSAGELKERSEGENVIEEGYDHADG